MQYGLAALNAGVITKAQFLDLNERIGGYDHSTYPLVEDGGCFTGMVSEIRLRRTVARKQLLPERRGDQLARFRQLADRVAA